VNSPSRPHKHTNRRAIGEDDKLLRRQAILDAAQGLFLAQPRELPSVSQIAQACGLAKGTFYLYFRTKEEVFLALLAEQFEELFELVCELLRDDSLSDEARISSFVQRYTIYLQAHPAFLRLAALVNTVAEPNVEAMEVLAFKRALAERLSHAGGLIERSFPGCVHGTGASLLMRIYALTIGLWQMLDVPDNIAAHIQDDPALDVFRRDFFVELPDALKQLFGSAG
jgi:AcrR family transcriptional regulator